MSYAETRQPEELDMEWTSLEESFEAAGTTEEDTPARAGARELQEIADRIYVTQPREETDGAPTDLLDLYFWGMERIELLNAEEEIVLAKQLEAGEVAAELLDTGNLAAGYGQHRDELELQRQNGQKARKMFVEANLRLVVNQASAVKRKGNKLPLNELIQEGNAGLLRAVEKFDWRREYKFSTYATWWIRQSIQRGTANTEHEIRRPVKIHDHQRWVNAAKARLKAEDGAREPTATEIAQATGLTEKQVVDVQACDHAMTSLDRTVGSQADSGTVESFIPDQQPTPEEVTVELVTLEEWREAIRTALSKLPDKQAHIITKRFGLAEDEKVTLDDLAKELGCSREQVRILEKRALVTLHGILGPENLV